MATYCKCNTASVGQHSVFIQTVPKRIVTNEVLLNNYVDQDLQAMLRPLNLIPAMFFYSKYKISDNFVTSNTIFYNMFSVLYVITILVVYLIYMLGVHMRNQCFYSVFLYVTSICDYVFYSCGYILNAFDNIAYRHVNVLLVIKLQHTLRALSADGRMFKSVILYNWTNVICLVVFYISWNIYIQLSFYTFNVQHFVGTLFIICFDSNMLYAIGLLRILCKTLTVWMNSITRSELIKDTDKEHYWANMSGVYAEVLDAYKLVERTCQHQMVYYAVHTFVHALQHLVIFTHIKSLDAAANKNVSVAMIAMSFMWLAKNILILMTLSRDSERLYASMTEVRALCVVRATRRQAGVCERRACKNTARAQKTKFEKLRACGVFVVDARFALRVSSLISTYMLLLLQFSLLYEPSL